jgi:hypothetical protein
MGPLARAFRSSGLTLGRPPWYPSPSVAPKYLASELGSYQPDLPALVKLPSAPSNLELVECCLALVEC